jgi:hypothetical protein
MVRLTDYLHMEQKMYFLSKFMRRIVTKSIDEKKKQANAGNYPFQRMEEYISLVLVEGSNPKAF